MGKIKESSQIKKEEEQKMKRSMFYVLTLVAAFSLVFASCAGAVTLNFLLYADASMPAGRVEQDVVAAFEAAYPDIELKIETLYDEAFHEKLAALAAAGALPDVMTLWPGGKRSGYLYEAGLIEDLYPYLGAEKANFVPGAVASQYEGKLMELPMGAGCATQVLFVNTELLDQLGMAMPQTFEEFKAMAPGINAAGLIPLIMPNKESWVMQCSLFSTIVGRIAGTEWLMDAIAGVNSFTDSEFVRSLEIVQEFYATGLIPVSSIQLAYGDSPPLFTEGEGVFMIDGDWRVGDFTATGGLMYDAPEEQAKIKLTVVPDFADQVGPSSSTALVATTGLGMKAGLSPEKAEAAFKLVRFYAGPEAARIRVAAGGGMAGIAPSYKYLDLSGIELSPLTVEIIGFYAKHPGTPVLDAVIVGDPIERINNGLQELGLGQITPEQLAAEVEAAFAR